MKLTPDMCDELLRLRGAGNTQQELVEYCKRKFGVAVNQSSLSRMLSKHRKERAEISRAIVQDYAEKTLPGDLEAADRIHAKYLQLTEAAIDSAIAEPTLSNKEGAAKLYPAYLRSQELKQKALGLDNTDPIVNGVAEFLALGFDEPGTTPEPGDGPPSGETLAESGPLHS